ncbi:formamidopyrimidine-DNA glycosylase [Peribacillus deserti]|uniref:Formamidopyrimidine-DNA glycosylase n=1 Tax=Peribacillus deserti TaxID=673318 RepID=A0ABS2QE30_9BACI|nr:Fpg/Nei family DNA glycosylase [Peribacillus deserti]MBM7691240.1 formamidopyrimidine-DNA glycosylase [Peribacillus deserti]
MPELPEMETYKTLLNQKIAGQVILDAEIGRIKSINIAPGDFISKVKCQTVIKVERRAKYLVFILSNGCILVLHLMLGGWMFFGKEEDRPKRTVQITLNFGANNLYFFGLRLGYLHLFDKETAAAELSDLGPEPLTPQFTLEFFIELLQNKRGRIKTKLIDQHFLSGIGNCYSDEICFQAKLLPMRDISSLSPAERTALYEAISLVLREAVRFGGYMENPLYAGDELTGGYDEKCKVYDREGEPCVRCGTSIRKEMISSRKTFYCTHCQI